MTTMFERATEAVGNTASDCPDEAVLMAVRDAPPGQAARFLKLCGCYDQHEAATTIFTTMIDAILSEGDAL